MFSAQVPDSSSLSSTTIDDLPSKSTADVRVSLASSFECTDILLEFLLVAVVAVVVVMIVEEVFFVSVRSVRCCGAGEPGYSGSLNDL